MAGKVWVVDDNRGSAPYVREYHLVRANEKSVTVMSFGGTEVVREAAGRTFFTDEEAMRTHVRKRLESLREFWAALIEEADKQLAGDVTVRAMRADRPAEWDAPVKLSDADL